jgi:hypothetical protein
VVVNVAAEHDKAVFIETDGRVRVPLVDGQLEMVRVRAWWATMSLFGNSTKVPVCTTSRCGTKRCSTWSMMALVPAGAELGVPAALRYRAR